MIADLVEQLRRETKFGAARLAAVLKADHGIVVAPVTVHRIMVRRGINRVADLDPPTGDQMRAVLRYEHDAPGAMVHVDVKKLGKIPTGGGWRIHGVGSDEHRASKRKGAGTGRIGYTYLHTAIDDHSRLAYGRLPRLSDIELAFGHPKHPVGRPRQDALIVLESRRRGQRRVPAVLGDYAAQLRVVGYLTVEDVLDFGNFFYLLRVETDRTVRMADRVMPAAEVVTFRRCVRSGRGATSVVSTPRRLALF